MNGLNVDPSLLTALQQSLNKPANPTAMQGAIGQAQAQMPVIPAQPVPSAQPTAPELSPPQVATAPAPAAPSAAGGLSPTQQQVLAKVSALPPASQQKFKEAIMQAARQRGQVR